MPKLLNGSIEHLKRHAATFPNLTFMKNSLLPENTTQPTG